LLLAACYLRLATPWTNFDFSVASGFSRMLGVRLKADATHS